MERRAWLVGLALLLAGGCGNARLQSAGADLSVAPSALTFSNVYLGASSTQSVTLSNSGAGGDTVTLALSAGSAFAFAGPARIAVGGGASATVPVTFTSGDAGSYSNVLTLTGESARFSVALTGLALPALDCAASGPCDLATFVPDAGACQHVAIADGHACVSPSLCLQGTVCQAGSCVGTPLDCDDHDACTRDYCVEGQGCQHDDTSAACAGNGVCQVYGCDPASGCTSGSAPDGTLCSLNDSCQTAEVCLLGNCVGVPVPDGTQCPLWWEPCVADATCHSGTCDSPTADAEEPGQLRWDAGLSGAIGPLAVDDAGDSLFAGELGCTECQGLSFRPVLASFDACGATRWNKVDEGTIAGAMIDGDQLIAWTSDGRLLGLSPANGATLWTLDLTAALGSSAWFAGAPALSSQGLVYLPVQQEAPFRALLIAAYRDGQIAWNAPLPFDDEPLVLTADRAGNAYVANIECLGHLACPAPQAELLAFGPSGAPLFSTSLTQGGVQDLALGTDFLFAEGADLALNPRRRRALPDPRLLLRRGGHRFKRPAHRGRRARRQRRRPHRLRPRGPRALVVVRPIPNRLRQPRARRRRDPLRPVPALGLRHRRLPLPPGPANRGERHRRGRRRDPLVRRAQPPGPHCPAPRPHPRRVAGLRLR